MSIAEIASIAFLAVMIVLVLRGIRGHRRSGDDECLASFGTEDADAGH